MKNNFKLNIIQIVAIILSWLSFCASFFVSEITKYASLETTQRFQYFLMLIEFIVLSCSFAKCKMYTVILCALSFVLHIILAPVGSYGNNSEYIFMLISNYFSLLLLPLLFIFRKVANSSKRKHVLICTTTTIFCLLFRTQIISTIFTLNPPLTAAALLEAIIGGVLICAFYCLFVHLTSKIDY